jgi:hypothetical protein
MLVVTPQLAALGRLGDSFRHQTNPMPTPPHSASHVGQEAETRYISMHVSSVVRSPSTEAARVEQSQLNFPGAPMHHLSGMS